MFVQNFNNYLTADFSGEYYHPKTFNGSVDSGYNYTNTYKLFKTSEAETAHQARAFYFSADADPNFDYTDYTFNNIADVYGDFTATPGIDNENKYYVQFAISIHNNSANEVTLKNIYYCGDNSSNSGGAVYSNINNKFLIWEDTLAEPITIAAGATYNFNLKITIGSVA